MLDQKTKDRMLKGLKKEFQDHPGLYDMTFEYDLWAEKCAEIAVAHAAAEAERAQGLVEAMQKIRKQPLKINDVWIIIDEALTKYNQPK